MSKQYQIVILGGGIGGYTAAICAAQHGKTVALVERDKLGGTCLHRGCIPSKSLLRSAEVLATMKESEAYGIEASGVTLNFTKVQERKHGQHQSLNQLPLRIRSIILRLSSIPYDVSLSVLTKVRLLDNHTIYKSQ